MFCTGWMTGVRRTPPRWDVRRMPVADSGSPSVDFARVRVPGHEVRTAGVSHLLHQLLHLCRGFLGELRHDDGHGEVDDHADGAESGLGDPEDAVAVAVDVDRPQHVGHRRRQTCGHTRGRSGSGALLPEDPEYKCWEEA